MAAPHMTTDLAMKLALVVISALTLAACDDGPDQYAGSSVARICRDGSVIYKTSDGRYVSHWGREVEDVEKVCQ